MRTVEPFLPLSLGPRFLVVSLAESHGGLGFEVLAPFSIWVKAPTGNSDILPRRQVGETPGREEGVFCQRGPP